MAGNYGGSSIPTTPIAGANITDAAYRNYSCTAAMGGTYFDYSVDGAAAVRMVMPTTGEMIEMVISPGRVTAVSGSVVFLCYDCSCTSPMTGITTSEIYQSATQKFHPTIIGGGGLNS